MSINIGVIGCGYWGPNIVRVLNSFKDVQVTLVSDLKDERLEYIKELFPNIKTTKNYIEILKDKTIDAIAIATPVLSHYKIALESLENNKHVFVEKPLTKNSKDAITLIDKAKSLNKVLMVGHTFVYTASVNKLKELIDSNELGEIYYINCQRLNLGLFQNDINVMWDLAPHDISIINFLFNKKPLKVTASGSCHINPKIEDVSMINLQYDKNMSAYIHSSWLDPNKVRKITIVGSKKMVVYDDIEPIEKIKIYSKGVDKPSYYDGFGEFQYSYRYGDISIPMLSEREPLKNELEHFCDCIINNKTPITDGNFALDVISILEEAELNINNDKRL